MCAHMAAIPGQVGRATRLLTQPASTTSAPATTIAQGGGGGGVPDVSSRVLGTLGGGWETRAESPMCLGWLNREGGIRAQNGTRNGIHGVSCGVKILFCVWGECVL